MKSFLMMSAGILFMASGLRGQSVSPAILRIERVQPGEAVCALVSDDGTYRLEKMFQNKNEMYKGTMELSRLDQLRTLIANQQLSGLSQADIHKPLVTDTADDMQLAVRRRGGWQELVFISPGSRKPFKRALDPLLHWFQDLQKQRPSAARVAGSPTSCMPMAENQLVASVVPETPKAIAVADVSGYLFRIYSSHFYHGRVDASCTVVFGGGRFRRERGGQTYMKDRRDKITEGQLAADDIRQLKEVLDAQELKNSPENSEDPPQWVIEGSWTGLDIPRKDKVQKLLFETTFNTLNDQNDIGGKSNMDYRIANKKLLEPLARWMKEHTDKQAGVQSEGVGNDCYPGKTVADAVKPAQ